jgi:hypothetical protein
MPRHTRTSSTVAPRSIPELVVATPSDDGPPGAACVAQAASASVEEIADRIMRRDGAAHAPRREP